MTSDTRPSIAVEFLRWQDYRIGGICKRGQIQPACRRPANAPPLPNGGRTKHFTQYCSAFITTDAAIEARRAPALQEAVANSFNPSPWTAT
jgi:hypothetical protein